MFNRSEIMKAAWAATKAEIAAYPCPLSPGSRRFIFASNLRQAWANAKAARRKVADKAEPLRQRLFLLECKDKWTDRDHDTARRLRDEIRMAA